MSKTYFIDSENVGDNWIALLGKASADDTILVYYTMKSPHMNYRNLILLKQSDKEVTFIECNYGNNALDFQLCTDLGYRVHDIGDGEFIIVSNDTGYDAVVRFWRKRGVSVKRIKGNACSSVDTYEEPLDEEETVSPEAKAAAPEDIARETAPAPETTQAPATVTVTEESAPSPAAPATEAPAEETVPEDNTQDASLEEAQEMLYCIGLDNLVDLHDALKKTFGEASGKTFYTEFKTKSSYKSFISKHKKLSRDEKQKLYTGIVFKENHTDMPKGLPEFLVKSWKQKPNLNSLRSALLGKYSKGQAREYYDLIKAHIKILNNIK
ncbi:hypothetical protein SAMN02910339_00378 [Lachnospiraceae bacterium YSD2013]|nr:hypothetical protein SAMN02910339_00378 [Lachnospiraceae bacterium YSD2013]